jgi:PAS domain S-box-containing protein
MSDDTGFEDLLAGFATALSAAGPADLDREIHRRLGQLGRFFGARNMGIGELVGTTTPFACVWSLRADVVPVDSMYDDVPWTTARLMRGEALVLKGGLDGLPPEAEADRRAYEAAGGHPDVIMPLLDGDAVVGGMGIGLPDFERVWSETLRRRLALVARVLGIALGRRRQLLELENGRYFEILTSEVVRDLHSTGDIGAALESALEKIGRHFHASRCILATLPGTVEALFGRHVWRWRSEDLPDERDLLPPPVPEKLVEPLVRGEPIIVRSLDEVPDAFRGLEDFLKAVGCASWVLWPLRGGKPPLVVLVVEWLHERRDWDEKLQDRIEVLAEVLGKGLAELQLRDTESRAQAFMDGNPSIIYIKDEELRHLYGNRALLETFGRAESDFVGTVATDFLPPQAASDVEALDRKVLADGAPVTVPAYSIEIAGETRWFQEAKFPVPLADGRALVGGIAFDISEQRRAQEHLAAALAEVEELKTRLEEENVSLREQVRERSQFPDFVGESAALRQVLHRVEQVAPSEATCLIGGETGTGKERVAEAIHRSSARRDRPLVKVNCAALPPSLVESELFGHEKGAFTGADRRKLGRFELADGGTLFLDEVGDLGPEVQAKLLRVLHDGSFERVGGTETLKVDVRILAATNHDLEEAVRSGRFRDDLFYRLNVFPITVPPLRERREDIPLLLWYFVGRFASAAGRKIDRIPQDLMEDFVRYDWPGNVRELANMVERAVILSPGPVLRLDDASPFGARESHLARGEDEPARSRPRRGVRQSLQDVERYHIRDVLEECGWKVSGLGGAAEVLGLKESTLRFQMKRLGIRRPSSRRGRAAAAPRPGPEVSRS